MLLEDSYLLQQIKLHLLGLVFVPFFELLLLKDVELALLIALFSELHQHLVHLLDELLVYVFGKNCVLS